MVCLKIWERCHYWSLWQWCMASEWSVQKIMESVRAFQLGGRELVSEAREDFNSSSCNSKLIGARYLINKGLLKAHPNTQIRMNSDRDTVGLGTYICFLCSTTHIQGLPFTRSFGESPTLSMVLISISTFFGMMDDLLIEQNLLATTSFHAMKKGVHVGYNFSTKWGLRLETLHKGSNVRHKLKMYKCFVKMWAS